MRDFLLGNQFGYMVMKLLALVGCFALISFLGLVGVFGVTRGKR